MITLILANWLQGNKCNSLEKDKQEKKKKTQKIGREENEKKGCKREWETKTQYNYFAG